jgi:MFS family permease
VAEARPGAPATAPTPASASASAERRSTRAAFAVPAYRRYWASQLISGIGTWAQAIAQSWLVLQLTHSPVALGTITMLQFLPMLVFPLFGGVIADRLPRRRLLITTQTGAFVQAVILGLLVWSGTVQYWEVGVLAFALGMTNAFGNPAQQALVPEIVGRDLVGNAIALNSIQFNVARLMGGAVGGLLVATLGIAPTLFLNAASYLPAIAVLATLRPAYAAAGSRSGASGGPRPAVTGEIAAGIRFALGSPPIRKTLALFGIIGLLGFNWGVALPLLTVALGAGPTGFGALMSAFGGGSLVAGFLLMRSREATERRLVVGGLALGTLLVLLGLSSSYAVTLALMFVAGLAGITATVTANTRLQLLTTDAYRGRVSSMFVLLMGGTTPIGALLLGGIAEVWGIQAGLLVFGVLAVIGLIAVLAFDRGRAGAPDATPDVAWTGHGAPTQITGTAAAAPSEE